MTCPFSKKKKKVKDEVVDKLEGVKGRAPNPKPQKQNILFLLF